MSLPLGSVNHSIRSHRNPIKDNNERFSAPFLDDLSLLSDVLKHLLPIYGKHTVILSDWAGTQCCGGAPTDDLCSTTLSVINQENCNKSTFILQNSPLTLILENVQQRTANNAWLHVFLTCVFTLHMEESCCTILSIYKYEAICWWLCDGICICAKMPVWHSWMVLCAFIQSFLNT